MAEPRGRTAMITGAGGGIGRACAVMFAEQGANVLAVDLDAEAARATCDAVEALGARALPAVIDVTRRPDVAEAVRSGLEAFGGIDALVHAVGIASTAQVVDLEEDVWDRMLNVNLKSAFLCAQAVLPDMIARHFGRIVLLTSRAAHKGREGTGAYSASKGGLLAFARVLASEIGRHGITVNCIAPGTTVTPMFENYFGPEAQTEQALETGVVVHPIRLARPEEIAAAALYLCGPHSEHITGSTIHVNGGTFMP